MSPSNQFDQLSEKKQGDQIYGLTPSENQNFSALKYQVFKI